MPSIGQKQQGQRASSGVCLSFAAIFGLVGTLFIIAGIFPPASLPSHDRLLIRAGSVFLGLLGAAVSMFFILQCRSPVSGKGITTLQAEKTESDRSSVLQDATIVYNWRQYPRVYQYALGLFICALGAVSLLVASRHVSSPWSIFGYVFLVVGFFALVEQQTRIDTESHKVSREGRLFGWLRLWFTRHPLGDFTAVTCRRFEQAQENDTIFIGLRRQSGRVMEVRQFTVANGYPCESAHREAEALARRLGLPLDDCVP